MTENWRKRQKREHFEKYDKLTRATGIKFLSACITNSISRDRIKRALETDEHLNNIPLSQWDSIAIGCAEKALATHMPYKYITLAESVCALKHVARYYIAEEE